MQICNLGICSILQSGASSTIVEAARDARFLSPLDLRSYYTKVNDKVSVLCGTKTPSLIDRVAIDSLEAVIKMSRSLNLNIC